jgi:hypothetical protein
MTVSSIYYLNYYLCSLVLDVDSNIIILSVASFVREKNIFKNDKYDFLGSAYIEFKSRVTVF